MISEQKYDVYALVAKSGDYIEILIVEAHNIVEAKYTKIGNNVVYADAKSIKNQYCIKESRNV